MKATLKTRCGCTQVLDAPYPPLPKVRVPMYPDFNFHHGPDDVSKPVVQIREFELREFDNRGPELSTALYYEVMGA